MDKSLTMEKIMETPWVTQTLKAVLILVVGWVLVLLLRLALEKFEKAISKTDAIRESGDVLRMKTFSHLLKWIGATLIWLCVIYMLLSSWGINVAPLLAGAGVVGLAFGFGGQYLIRDIINGIFILVEGQFRINDVVQIEGLGGVVEAVNLRHTRLRDLEGRVIYIPNGEIKTVINFTQEYSQALLNVGVAYHTDVDHAIRVIKELGAEMREDGYFKHLILNDLEMLGVDDFSDSQITLKFRMKTLPIKQWEVAREFRRRLKARFDQEKIQIAFPHRLLYWGTGQNPDKRDA
ncbi:MAG TPA: mechanosensitive ion channel family protein [Candidatus Omnitrophota bacterium]|nr:mechanosensitive ion channel family protein [Candidatus Omnitrophota bacterium]